MVYTPWCTKITPCAAGKYVETKATMGYDALCTRCESKTFTDKENADACLDLKTCGENEFVSTPGTRSSDRECSGCPDGTYQTAKSHSEQACMTTTTTSTASTITYASWKGAVMFFGWVSFFFSLRSLRVRPMGQTCGESNEIELTAAHG